MPLLCFNDCMAQNPGPDHKDASLPTSQKIGTLSGGRYMYVFTRSTRDLGRTVEKNAYPTRSLHLHSRWSGCSTALSSGIRRSRLDEALLALDRLPPHKRSHKGLVWAHPSTFFARLKIALCCLLRDTRQVPLLHVSTPCQTDTRETSNDQTAWSTGCDNCIQVTAIHRGAGRDVYFGSAHVSPMRSLGGGTVAVIDDFSRCCARSMRPKFLG